MFLAAGVTLLLLGIFELIWRFVVARWFAGLHERHPRLLGPLP
jgi:hypothetical protein